jgi:large subunit ribosomal protein L18e
MVRTIKYQDPGRVELIRQIQSETVKNGSKLWSAVADELSKVRKNRREVNVYKIQENSSEGDVVIVPGKVLGDGKINHKVDVAAYRFTSGAEKKIKQAGGATMSITELLGKNPEGKKIKLIG